MITYMIFMPHLPLTAIHSKTKIGVNKWELTFDASVFSQFDLCRLADSGFFLDFQYQGGVKSTVSGVFDDLKFKISEG